MQMRRRRGQSNRRRSPRSIDAETIVARRRRHHLKCYISIINTQLSLYSSSSSAKDNVFFSDADALFFFLFAFFASESSPRLVGLFPLNVN